MTSSHWFRAALDLETSIFCMGVVGDLFEGLSRFDSLLIIGTTAFLGILLVVVIVVVFASSKRETKAPQPKKRATPKVTTRSLNIPAPKKALKKSKVKATNEEKKEVVATKPKQARKQTKKEAAPQPEKPVETIPAPDDEIWDGFEVVGKKNKKTASTPAVPTPVRAPIKQENTFVDPTIKVVVEQVKSKTQLKKERRQQEKLAQEQKKTAPVAQVKSKKEKTNRAKKEEVKVEESEKPVKEAEIAAEEVFIVPTKKEEFVEDMTVKDQIQYVSKKIQRAQREMEAMQLQSFEAEVSLRKQEKLRKRTEQKLAELNARTKVKGTTTTKKKQVATQAKKTPVTYKPVNIDAALKKVEQLKKALPSSSSVNK